MSMHSRRHHRARKAANKAAALVVQIERDPGFMKRTRVVKTPRVNYAIPGTFKTWIPGVERLAVLKTALAAIAAKGWSKDSLATATLPVKRVPRRAPLAAAAKVGTVSSPPTTRQLQTKKGPKHAKGVEGAKIGTHGGKSRGNGAKGK
jgi:hypothetical protein